MSRVDLLQDVARKSRDLASTLEELAAVFEATGKESAPKAAPKPAPAITLEEVRAVLAKKSHAGLTAEVRGLLEAYGASKLSEVDPEHYADLLQEAEAL
ncbi:hypothetical protein [Salisediminibacterium selenitireducens]|uniref:rRNA biogenesis protein rrp5 n=1 Tax=Bacillus selenitireducens (strain ATCC 700615 / DSM 15326 / MLS10) TaxID=439292 RepID=D6XYY9_BACIE|nr:hypothetical protein [Salisediminibacterium selenitireducens]ADH98297.1 hypothetical protein Bsel_0768 [[Bacillus] selenitireducens MLS10]